MENKKLISVIAAACIISLLVGFAGGVVFEKSTGMNLPVRTDAPPEIPDELGKIMPEQRAKEIAVERADLTMEDVSFIKAERDFENGRKIYDIEFVSGNTEYSVEIMAETGEIVSFEQEAR